MFAEISKKITQEAPFALMTVGNYEQQQWINRPNGFDVHQFIWVTKGAGVFKCEGEKRILAKGQGLFTRCEVAHEYKSAEGEFSTAWITFKNGEQILDYYGVGDYLFFNVPDFLEESVNRLEELCKRSPSPMIRSANGYMFTIELLESIFEKDLSQSRRVISFLENNYDKPLTLEMIAEYAEIDKFKLCHDYPKETHETVMQTLKRIRLSKAKRFLRYCDYPIEQIGKMCGFESSSYFIKNFRDEMGLTPKQYRTGKKDRE